MFADTVAARAVMPLRTPVRAFAVATRPVCVVVLWRTVAATGAALVALLALMFVRCATRALFVAVVRGDVATSRDFIPVRACVALRDVADVRALTFRAEVSDEPRTLGDTRAAPRPVAPERDVMLDGWAIG